MRFLTAGTDGWVDAPEGESSLNDAVFEPVREFLNNMLLANDLAVLTGLGTSLGLEGEDGRRAPSMGDLWDSVRAAVGEEFPGVVASVGYQTPSDGDNIELLISRAQSRIAIEDVPTISQFITDAEAAIADNCRFVDDSTDLNVHESFLRTIARRGPSAARMQLFTTNYDIAFETAANRSGFLAVDGFSYGQPSEFEGSYFDYDFVRRSHDSMAVDLVPNVFQLFKLHGSINWQRREGRIEKVSSPASPLLIYPADSKFRLTYDQPFLENMSRFQLALRKPDSAVMIIGSGLRDAHLAQPLKAAVHSNVSQMYLVVDLTIEQSDSPLIGHLMGLVAKGDSRIALLEAKFSDLAALMPSIRGQSELETHQERLRVVTREQSD